MEAEEVADVVIWNVERVAVGVFPVLPPSALLSQEVRGVAAPWWGSPPIKSAKVLRRSFIIEIEYQVNAKNNILHCKSRKFVILWLYKYYNIY